MREWAQAVKEAVAMPREALAWLMSDDCASLSCCRRGRVVMSAGWALGAHRRSMGVSGA
jgi:hypothetical protein